MSTPPISSVFPCFDSTHFKGLSPELNEALDFCPPTPTPMRAYCLLLPAAFPASESAVLWSARLTFLQGPPQFPARAAEPLTLEDGDSRSCHSGMSWSLWRSRDWRCGHILLHIWSKWTPVKGLLATRSHS